MVKLDWRSCLKEKIVKKVNEDRNRILALKRISQKKFEGANILPKQHYYSKITLLYDAIRTNLECLALENGYKIYNHQCYVPFLKEVLQKSDLADMFNKLRLIRNGINYQGTEIDLQESKYVIKDLKTLCEKLQNLRTKSKKPANTIKNIKKKLCK